MFRRDAYRITSTDSNIVNLDQLFDVMLNKSGKSDTNNIHNLWRINRMFLPGIALRALFPAPKTLPEHAGIDIERYIAFDINGGTTYQLPSTDCSNMFVYQAIGSRIIHLKPTVECKDQCRRITVKLKENHTCKHPFFNTFFSLCNLTPLTRFIYLYFRFFFVFSILRLVVLEADIVTCSSAHKNYVRFIHRIVLYITVRI